LPKPWLTSIASSRFPGDSAAVDRDVLRFHFGLNSAVFVANPTNRSCRPITAVGVVSTGLCIPEIANREDVPPGFLDGVPRGRLEPETVIRLLRDVAMRTDIVGLAITWYISWDAIQKRQFLAGLPLILG